MNKRLLAVIFFTGVIVLLILNREYKVEGDSDLKEDASGAKFAKVSYDDGYHMIQGFVFGTVYSIKYRGEEELRLKDQIEDRLNRFSLSLSPYSPNSIISRVNRGESVKVDSLFKAFFTLSKEVFTISEGAFDPTVGPLVNAWGFGTKKGRSADRDTIAKLHSLVGFDKLSLESGSVCKDVDGIVLDGSAIAKGMAVDYISELLDLSNCSNYMVEIGGEIRAKGLNSEGAIWKIGITDPNSPNDYLSVMELDNRAMATSGNYRNYYEVDGKRYAHTIDPQTGAPAENSVLSATVISSSCGLSDALATACMVLGLEKSREMTKSLENVSVVIIYDFEGENRVWQNITF